MTAFKEPSRREFLAGSIAAGAASLGSRLIAADTRPSGPEAKGAVLLFSEPVKWGRRPRRPSVRRAAKMPVQRALATRQLIGLQI